MVVLLSFLLIFVCVMFLVVFYVLPLCAHDYVCVATCNGDFHYFACAFAHGVAFFDVSPLSFCSTLLAMLLPTPLFLHFLMFQCTPT
jgi:hypothetical protein